MSDYEVVHTNADNIDGCSFCGYKNVKTLGYRRKTNWLKKRYAEGLRYEVRGGYCGGVQSLGAKAKGGSSQERRRVKGAPDALWHVQYHSRWEADRRPSCQRNEILEHHEEGRRTKRCSQPPARFAVGRFGRICLRLLQPTGRFRRRSLSLDVLETLARIARSSAPPDR